MQQLAEAIQFEVIKRYPSYFLINPRTALDQTMSAAIKAVIQNSPEDTKFLVIAHHDELTIGYTDKAFIFLTVFIGFATAMIQLRSEGESDNCWLLGQIAIYFVVHFEWFSDVVDKNVQKFEVEDMWRDDWKDLYGEECRTLTMMVAARLALYEARQVSSQPSNA